MPDSSTIKIGAAHYQAPEVLFRPELMGYEYASVPTCIVNAVQVCRFYSAFIVVFMILAI